MTARRFRPSRRRSNATSAWTTSPTRTSSIFSSSPTRSPTSSPACSLTSSARASAWSSSSAGGPSPTWSQPPRRAHSHSALFVSASDSAKPEFGPRPRRLSLNGFRPASAPSRSASTRWVRPSARPSHPTSSSRSAPTPTSKNYHGSPERSAKAPAGAWLSLSPARLVSSGSRPGGYFTACRGRASASPPPNSSCSKKSAAEDTRTGNSSDEAPWSWKRVFTSLIVWLLLLGRLITDPVWYFY